MDRTMESKKRGMLLGCVSMGVKNLTTKLKKKTGKSMKTSISSDTDRSMKSHSDRASPVNSMTSASSVCSEPSYNSTASSEDVTHKLDNLELKTMTIHKCVGGYGFTVKNTQPVRVGRVKPEGAAENAGLLRGDYIIRLNGQNVANMTAQRIAYIVRHSAEFLVVDYCRKPSKTRHTCQQERLPNNHHHVYESISDADSGMTEGDMSSQSVIDVPRDDFMQDENLPPIPAYLATAKPRSKSSLAKSQYAHLTPSMGSARSTMTFEETKKSTSTPNRAGNREVTRAGSMKMGRSYSKWDPDISVIPTCESLKGRRIISYCDINQSKSQFSSFQTESSMPLDTWLEASSEDLETSEDIDFSEAQNGSYYEGVNAPNCTLADSSFEVSFDGESADSVTSSQSLGSMARIFGAEQDFTDAMQKGIQQFSRPLRHCILSAEQQGTLFQNIEKLVALSEYNLNQLSACLDAKIGCKSVECEDTMVEKVYLPRVKLLLSAYQSYVNGLPAALDLLRQLRNHRQFVSFVQQQTVSDISIDEFIRRPLLHLQAISRTIAPLTHHSAGRHSPDWSTFTEVVKKMAPHHESRKVKSSSLNHHKMIQQISSDSAYSHGSV